MRLLLPLLLASLAGCASEPMKVLVGVDDAGRPGIATVDTGAIVAVVRPASPTMTMTVRRVGAGVVQSMICAHYMLSR